MTTHAHTHTPTRARRELPPVESPAAIALAEHDPRQRPLFDAFPCPASETHPTA